MPKITEVVAKEAGHDGRIFRSPGERFTVDLEDPRYSKSSWFVPVAKYRADPPRKVDPKARPPGAGPLPGSAVGEDTDNTLVGEGPKMPNPDTPMV